MKNGIFREDDRLVYYKDDFPCHAGAVEIDGDIYYVGRNGKVAVGQHIVHKEMSNGLLKRGTYTFDEEGKLIEGSYIPAKRITDDTKNTKGKKHRSGHKSHKFRLSKKTLGIVAGVLAGVLVLFCCAKIVDSVKGNYMGETPNAEQGGVYLSEFDEPVSLSTVVAQKVYKNEVSMAQLGKSNPYRPLSFGYQLNGSDGVLAISEHTDMSQSKTYIMSKFDTELEIDNLKTGTTYYYCVQVGEDVYNGSFETAEGIRFINIPGGENTRDIGGYKTRNGKTVKQGMIIRGTELDGLVEASYYLPEDKAEKVVRELGVVYDMDLRHRSVAYEGYTSALGDDVRHKFYDGPAYLSVFSVEEKDEVYEIFADLAKRENYPMYMHCTYGADRTGTVVYLLQGLLGVSEEDMLKEFQLTGFYNGDYADSTRMDSVMEKIQKFPGETTSAKIEYFLINEIGLEKSQINSIKSILLE